MKRPVYILLLCLISFWAWGQENNTDKPAVQDDRVAKPTEYGNRTIELQGKQDKKQTKKTLPIDSIYQGMTVKFDLGSAVYIPARNKGSIQTYDFALSARLFQKFFPTFEFGYAQANVSGAGSFQGYGGFMRLGADYSVLKKYKGENHLLVGIRIGTSLQDYSYHDIQRTGSYWQDETINYTNRFGADAWGEIVAGVQVQIYKGLNMGWYLRYKILMTRGKQLDGIIRPAYILGYGQRDDTCFGWNYYIGWMF